MSVNSEPPENVTKTKEDMYLLTAAQIVTFIALEQSSLKNSESIIHKVKN